MSALIFTGFKITQEEYNTLRVTSLKGNLFKASYGVYLAGEVLVRASFISEVSMDSIRDYSIKESLKRIKSTLTELNSEYINVHPQMFLISI